MRRMLALVAPAVLVLTLAGCSRSLPADDIERELERQLSTSEFVPDVACDGDLAAEVGATTMCSTTLQDDVDVDIKVTATEVSGDTVRYEFQVAPTDIDQLEQSTGPSTETPQSSGP